MSRNRVWQLCSILIALVFCASPLPSQTTAGAPVGIFEGHGDIGTVLHPGAVQYDPAAQTYTISGSGENMWFTADAFHYAWKKLSGDVSLTANISFVGSGGNPHRKAVLVIRQSLDPGSVYADVALHGSGLTSLQFRDQKAGTTHEVESGISGPARVRIIKRGDYVYMSLAAAGDPLQPSGASIKLPLQGPFYIGIGVCSHDKDVVEKAVFSHVELTPLSPVPAASLKLYSALETIAVASTDRRVMYSAPAHFEAPNWTRDNAAFIFNQDGKLWRLPVAGGTPEAIDTGFATQCNNDHGISPDGQQLAISDQSQPPHASLVYTLPIGGGTPRRITPTGPSYWHGWSPDGSTLAIVGQRHGEFDIYTVSATAGSATASSATAGPETRLTTAKGLDDGPEYSPDGKYIYFNSERTGHMQIWRMRADGSEQTQVTFDDSNDWFPHISPDGKWMVFLAYGQEVTGHPPNQDVTLQLMSLPDGKITLLAKLFGGQGTINVPSWSPDSLKLAFVSYELIPEEDLSGR